MIVTTLNGGLGNQLFQYAAGRYLAWKHNTKLKLDLTQCNLESDSHHAFYNLGAFNIQENFATELEIKNLPAIKNKNPWIFEPDILSSKDNIRLNGHWQSEKYFLEIEDILRRELTLKNPLGKISESWKKEILETECSVSVHIRHGDFMTYYARNVIGLLPINHYATCIKALKEKYQNITIFVFSDDLQWCKENLKFDVPTKFVEGCEHDYEEMYLMSLCKHNILSRGTFSWWGAWLNQNPDKEVFAPFPWQLCINYESDIIPDDWIKIPSDYDSWMPPMLSIVVCLSDNTSFVEKTLTSIMSQEFADYEIIFIDTSTNGGGQICRQLAKDIRVNILNTDFQTNKSAAWNKALEVARGDFVLFLTDEDFIMPDTTKSISKLSELIFKALANTREHYLNYSNYIDYLPNIVCSVSYAVSEESNKNFSIVADEIFSDLKIAKKIDYSNAEKLVGLATRNINNVVGTKFFKRKFLNENKIRFNENEKVDAELKFVVDAFLSTDKIIFTPTIFYVKLK